MRIVVHCTFVNRDVHCIVTFVKFGDALRIIIILRYNLSSKNSVWAMHPHRRRLQYIYYYAVLRYV